MHDTYGEMQHQTQAAKWAEYYACLNTQATQNTFLQVQSSAIDSHITAAASAQQAAVQIESERALVQVPVRAPESGEYLAGTPTNNNIAQLGVPFLIRNSGKSSANFAASIKAVLLEISDKFVIKDTSVPTMQGSVSAGAQIPGKRDPESEHKAVILLAPVEDINGKPVPYQSKLAEDFFKGNVEVLAYGSLKYTDSWGRYEAKFCYPVWFLVVGTGRPPSTPNELKCTNYNNQKDKYISRPSASKLTPLETGRLEPIKCEVPKDEPVN
jgi:hypothetical protein